MRQHKSLIILALCLMPVGLMAQTDTTAAKESIRETISDTTAPNAPKKPVPVAPAAAVIDSNDEYNFLELYYYGSGYEGMYDIYDPWDIYPDREGDSRERDSDSRDSQERDAREE